MTATPKLWSLPLTDLPEAWDDYDKGGTDLAGIRALCLEDRFYLLVKVCGRTDLLHPWIYARCREVERDPDGYLDIWGREHYKSTIITFGGGLQDALADPDLCTGIFSHTKPIAKAFLAQIKRELETNRTLLAAFPDVLWQNPAKDAPQWSLDGGLILKRSSNPKEATFEAHGLVDGQPTSRHFGKMIYDDVVTRESVGTPEQIQKTTEAWELSDNLGKQGGRKQHTGTRYSYADTYDAIIKRGACKLRHHPATSDGTITGRPVLFSQEEWDRKVRDQGEATISCQMLGNPLAGNQRMFNVEDLGTYEVRPEVLNVYITVDPAYSKKKDSDHTAMVVTGIDLGGNKYLLDGYDHKMALKERWERMRDLFVRWRREPGVMAVFVGYERYGADSDLQYFEERMQVEKVSFGIQVLAWPREGPGSKIDRVQRLGPDFRSHRYYLPYPTKDEALTKAQATMKSQGCSYRIARSIKRKDENSNVYDLSERLKMQVHYFPFGGLKDVIDAASRVYDMQPVAPQVIDSAQLEPEFL